MPHQDNLTQETARLAYTEANHHFRHYSNMRFTIVVAYLVGTTTLLTLLGATTVGDQDTKRAIMILGLVLSVVFAFFEARVEAMLTHYADSVRDQEKQMGISVIPKADQEKSGSRGLRTHTVVRGLFLVIGLGWLGSLWQYSSEHPTPLTGDWIKPEVWIGAITLIITAYYSFESRRLSLKALHYTAATIQQTVAQHYEEAKLNALQANLGALVEVWGRLGALPNGMRFHLKPEERAQLQKAGITDQEFAYLIAHFEAASLYYNHVDVENKGKPFPEGSIRRRLCDNEVVKPVLPIIARFFTDEAIYHSRIQATMNLKPDAGK